DLDLIGGALAGGEKGGAARQDGGARDDGRGQCCDPSLERPGSLVAAGHRCPFRGSARIPRCGVLVKPKPPDTDPPRRSVARISLCSTSMWRPDQIADIAGAALRERAGALRLEQAVRGLDALAEVEFHPILADAMAAAGFGVACEFPYPGQPGRRSRFAE